MISEDIDLKGIPSEWIEVPKGCNVRWNRGRIAHVEAENQELIEKFKKNWKNAKPPEPKKPIMIKEIHVKFLLPFSINLPNGVYGIKSENFSCTVNIRKKHTRENASGMIGGMHISDDRFGLTNHTNIIVRFLLAIEIENEKISHKQLKILSLEAINLILNQCRHNSSEYYNHDIVAKDFSGTEYQYYKLDGTVASGSSVLLGGSGVMTLSTSGSSVNDEQLQKIQNNLGTNTNLPFEIELIKNAIDFFRFENYRMASIEIETAIEVTYAFILREYLTNLQQTDASQVQSYLNSSVISNCTINDFPRSQWDQIKPVLRKATFVTIAGESECQNWQTKCQDLRHRVVHAGHKPGENEAKDAIDSGISFFKVLQQYHSNLSSENLEIEFPPQKSGEFLIPEEGEKIILKQEHFEDISQIDVNSIQEKNKELFQQNKEKDFPKIIETYDELLKYDPLNVDFWLNKGDAYFNSKDYPKAEKCYEKSIEIDNTEPNGFVGLANVQVSTKNVLEGLSNYLNALRINPEHQFAMRNRGITLFRNKLLDDARCQFKFILEKNPSDAISWYELSLIEALKENKVDSIKFLKQAIKFDKTCKDNAREESIFKKYEHDEEFQKLISES